MHCADFGIEAIAFLLVWLRTWQRRANADQVIRFSSELMVVCVNCTAPAPFASLLASAVRSRVPGNKGDSKKWKLIIVKHDIKPSYKMSHLPKNDTNLNCRWSRLPFCLRRSFSEKSILNGTDTLGSCIL